MGPANLADGTLCGKGTHILQMGPVVYVVHLTVDGFGASEATPATDWWFYELHWRAAILSGPS
jgi:hypothetical protein